MKNRTSILAAVVGLITFAAPLAFANAASLSIQSLTPGGTVPAKDKLTFVIVPTGISSPSYQFTDSFPNSSASFNNINVGGNFFWVPVASDVGTHVFTITANDSSGGSATLTQTIVVMPAPSVSMQSLSPSETIMPGTTLKFTVIPTNFTNPTYSISDVFSGTSINATNLDTQGNFSWTPDMQQNGEHTIEVYASDSIGHSATVRQVIHVGAGPSLKVGLLSPGSSIKPGTTVSFTSIPISYSPTSFGVTDSFTGSTISNSNISVNGLFSWTPAVADVGVHTLTLKGIIGFFGQSATTSVTITVLGVNGELPPTSSAPATNSSNATSSTGLAALQAQLAALMAQSAALKSAPAPTPGVSSGFVFTSYLRPKSEGDEVKELQKVLHKLGFLSDEPTGTYGSHTVDAVMKFQKAHGLTQLGVVGPATRDALNALSIDIPATTTAEPIAATGNGYTFKNFMGYGEDVTDGPDVKELQKRLISLGYLKGDASGYFGNATVAAVKKFQRANGVPETGYVGVLTRAALNK